MPSCATIHDRCQRLELVNPRRVSDCDRSRIATYEPSRPELFEFRVVQADALRLELDVLIASREVEMVSADPLQHLLRAPAQ